MPTNDFLPFAVGGSANVEVQSAWVAELALLSNGFTAGIAPSAKANKAWRQATAPSSQLAQFICDILQQDVHDDGNTGILKGQLFSALLAYDVFTDIGGVNTLTYTPHIAVPQLFDGFHFIGTVANSNTSSTVNAVISGLPSVPVRKRDGSVPLAQDLIAGQNYLFVYSLAANQLRVLTTLLSDLISGTSVSGRTQIFTTSGTFNVPPGVSAVEVEVIGAGGGGGASGDGSGGGVAGNVGGGGGAGGYGYKRSVAVTPLGSVAVTVGAGGTSPGFAAGNAGGTSSFGAAVTCTSGGGGSYGASTLGSGGAGGVPTGADLGIPGGDGGFTGPNVTSVTLSDAERMYSRGGVTGKGFGTITWGGTGSPGQGYGSGGGGASGGSGVAGGAGAPGLVIVRW